MKRLIFPLFCISLSLKAQELVPVLESIQTEIGQDVVDDYLKRPSKEGLSGSFLGTFLPKENIDPERVCLEENKTKNPRYEVVVVAEVNSKASELEILPGQKAQIKTLDLNFISRDIPYSSSKDLTVESVNKRATQLWNSGRVVIPGGSFDPHTPVGRELFMEGIVHAAANSQMNEKDLSRSIAGVIGSVYKTDEDRFNALSALSLRLYRNYNGARTPGFNNPKNNPFGVELPPGDMTVNQLMQAAGAFDTFQGGVCNDISEAVIMVGEHLFPDQDVLAINSGTHFGVLLTDGKKTRVIDGGTQYEMSNRLMLDPRLSSTNLRISKVENGALKEIAVVDTEMGQVMEAAFETGKKLLKTDADISTLMGHLKKEKFGLTIGTGRLSDSQVVVVVAKYETGGERWKSYVGAGASAEKHDGDIENKYQLHFRAGAERNILRFVHEDAELKFTTGGRLLGMYALNHPKNTLGGVGRYDYSGAADLYNRVDVKFGDEKKVKVNSSLEVEHTLGPKNWGNTTGALSYMSPGDTPSVLKNMSFHLNQVNAELNLEKRVTPKVTGLVKTSYQGSNIGQSISALVGVNIRIPEGAQLLVFTGYTNADLPGYKTKHSLLGTPTGAQAGVTYTTKGGTEVGAQVRTISGGRPSVNATLKVPLDGK